MSMHQIYHGADKLISQLLKKESFAQGHYLTGALDDSFAGVVKKDGKAFVLEGRAVYYARILNEGVTAERVSWKQLPFLIRYFQQRGLEEKEATRAGAATIKVWMREGMPTQASKRFSSTGNRKSMIEAVFTGYGSVMDEYMINALDFDVSEKFKETKTETV